MSNPDSLATWNSKITPVIYRIQNQEKQALKELHNLTANKLLGMVLRIVKSPHDAEEIVQDVFIKLWDKAQQFSGNGSAWGWLCVLTRHTALDYLRSHTRHQHESTDDNTQLLETLVSEWNITDSHSIKSCLQHLRDNMRQSVLMAYVYGYSHNELAQKMSAPLGTVKAWVRRGLQELKLCLTA